jgi:hypothetical protein
MPSDSERPPPEFSQQDCVRIGFMPYTFTLSTKEKHIIETALLDRHRQLQKTKPTKELEELNALIEKFDDRFEDMPEDADHTPVGE